MFATVFPKGDLAKELTDAAARMGDLRITTADLDREKPRLLDEISNMFGRLPALGAVNIARELVRPTPQGGRKGGLPEHINAITLDDVRAHWKQYYNPKNAILVLAGAVDDAAALKAVTAHFAKLVPGEEVPKPGEPGSLNAGALRELAVNFLQPQAGPVACLAYAAPEPGSENLCAVPRVSSPVLGRFAPTWQCRRDWPALGLLPLAGRPCRARRECNGQSG